MIGIDGIISGIFRDLRSLTRSAVLSARSTHEHRSAAARSELLWAATTAHSWSATRGKRIAAAAATAVHFTRWSAATIELAIVVVWGFMCIID